MECARCHEDKPRSEFGPSADMWPNHRQCHQCNRTRAQLSRHGLTAADRALIAYPTGCQICGHEEPGNKGWVVDHDRSCCSGDKSCPQCRRGVVCCYCNSMLGFAFDRVETLRRAIDYLTRERDCTWHYPIECRDDLCGSDSVEQSLDRSHEEDGEDELTKTDHPLPQSTDLE